MSNQTQALQLVEQFRTRPAGIKAWIYVYRQALAKGMHDRILNPNGVWDEAARDGGYGLCGPASILRDLIADDPVGYVQLTTSLYWNGWGRFARGPHSGTTLVASADLRNFRFSDDINSADWVVTATLRDSLNRNKGPDFLANLSAGATFAQEAQMMDAVGYQHVVRHGAFNVPASRSLLGEAQYYLSKNYRVIIAVDATLFDPLRQDAPPTGRYPHWADLLAQFMVNGSGVNETVSFSAYSWGQRHDLPSASWMPLHMATLQQKFFGYVAGKY